MAHSAVVTPSYKMSGRAQLHFARSSQISGRVLLPCSIIPVQAVRRYRPWKSPSRTNNRLTSLDQLLLADGESGRMHFQGLRRISTLLGYDEAPLETELAV